MYSIGGKVRGRENAEQGSLWDWIKIKQRDTNSFTLVSTRVTNSQFSTQRWCLGNKVTMRALWSLLWCCGCALRRPENRNYPDVPKVCCLRCRKTKDRLI